jgi:hypothetical protein
MDNELKLIRTSIISIVVFTIMVLVLAPFIPDEIVDPEPTKEKNFVTIGEKVSDKYVQ